MKETERERENEKGKNKKDSRKCPVEEEYTI
jgi:hypothetical protein